MYDIVFVQLGLDVLERNIAKSSQSNLNEMAVSDCTASERLEINLVC